MKKIIVLAVAALLLFSFCGKKDEEVAKEKTAGELFDETMVNMQRISVACATLYKERDKVAAVDSLIDLAKVLAEYKTGDKPLVALVTGVKSIAELEAPEPPEGEELLRELLLKTIDEAALKKDYIDEGSGKLKIKLILKDAWGGDFYFKSDGVNWWIGSGGSDGQFAGFDQEGDYKHLGEEGEDISAGKDIIFSGEKGFIYGPEV